MAGLEVLWAKFSLTEDEEGGADVPNQEAMGGASFGREVFHEESFEC